MKRPILLHGVDREAIRGIGSRLVELIGGEVRDLLDASVDQVLEAYRMGGGSLGLVSSEVMLTRATRIELLSRATVVWVQAEAGTGALIGLGGASVSEGAQAWLSGAVASDLGECHLRVACGGGVTEVEIAKAIAEVASREGVLVAARDRSYLVEVCRGGLERGLSALDARCPVFFYVTDANVERLHGARLAGALDQMGGRVVRHVLVPGEERKCLDTLGEMFDTALDGGIDRTSWLVAAGGGVTTDVGGLVAALWMRGLKWVAIPTTLLAMVDASVGGKTAVDHGKGKNAVGAFWQPSRVVCDVDFVTTESERNYVGALSEVVKTAVIGDSGLFELIDGQAARVLGRDLDVMLEVVQRCVRVKARIVGLDELESGLRAVLNFGHTVGHALEALGEYRRYTHGEAVSLGMIAALRLGARLGHTAPTVAVRVEGLLKKLGLPVTLDRDELVAAAELLGHDKKRAGSALRFVFARDVGDVRTERIALQDVRELVGSLCD
ncbi:MAG TPA: 3-dehydroquinate synthase [Polyangiaceae bacterium]